MKTATLFSLLLLGSTGAYQTRRAFVRSLPAAGALLVAGPSLAYERRDVGGTSRSPEQAAYNEQAFETNNRLEREGVKLETREEQQASLTAALKDYTYTSTTAKDNKKDKNKKP